MTTNKACVNKIARSSLTMLVLLVVAANIMAAETGKDASYVEAMIPIEVLAPESGGAKNELSKTGLRWDAGILAAQPARVARAIVVLESGEAFQDTLLNFVVLGKVLPGDGKAVLDVPLDRQAWCENTAGASATVKCFQDLDGNGTLDSRATGFLPKPDVLTLNRIGPSKPITAQRYRPAREDELLLLRLEYAYCSNDSAKLRYAQRVRRVKTPILFGGLSSSGCTQYAQQVSVGEDAEVIYRIGRMQVGVVEREGKITSRLVEAIPVGTMLGHLRTDRPFTDAVASVGFREDSSAQLNGLPFLFFVTAPRIDERAVKPGELLMSGEVTHGITGKLMEPLTSVGWGGKKQELGVDTPVYGVLMSSTTASRTLEPDIVWCAPPKQGGEKSLTLCMMNSGTGSYHLLATGSLFNVESLRGSSGDKTIFAPMVERGPVEFGEPLDLEIKFDKWEKRYAQVSVSVDRRSEPKRFFRRMSLRRSASGSSWLLIADKLVEIKPATDDVANAVLVLSRPLESGDDAQVLDAYQLQLEAQKRK